MEVLEFVSQMYEYDLYINDKMVSTNDSINITDSTIKITLSEKTSSYSVTTEFDLIDGTISGEYRNHLQLSHIPKETYSADATMTSAIHHVLNK